MASVKLLCALGATTAECDKEIAQGSSITLGTSTTAVALSDNKTNIQINNTIKYVEAMTHEELNEFDICLKELELQFNITKTTLDSPKIYTK